MKRPIAKEPIAEEKPSAKAKPSGKKKPSAEKKKPSGKKTKKPSAEEEEEEEPAPSTPPPKKPRTENVNKMDWAESGDDLEALEDRSTRLLSEAATFERSGRDVRRRQCCRDMKARAVLVCLLVLLIAGAAAVITGPVLKLWPRTLAELD